MALVCGGDGSYGCFKRFYFLELKMDFCFGLYWERSLEITLNGFDVFKIQNLHIERNQAGSRFENLVR